MDYPKSVPGVGLVGGVFVDENQTTGQQGSLIPSSWGNAVTDELLAVFTAAGLQPDEADNTQLLQALLAMQHGSMDYSPARQYRAGDVCYVGGYWYECYHPDGCKGIDPSMAKNRPSGWKETNASKPYYWIQIGKWLSLPEVGTPIYLPSTTMREGLLRYSNDANLHKGKFWRLAELYPSLVSGNFIQLADLRGEFLRELDAGRGVDPGRVVNSAQGDAMRNISGQFSDVHAGSLPAASGCFTWRKVGGRPVGQTGDWSYGVLNMDLKDLKNGFPIADENRSRSIALLAVLRF